MHDTPTQVDLTFEAGNACYRAGRFVDAAAHYRQVLRSMPGHCESHNNLGAALADLGQTDDAIACYLTALHLRPDYAEAHFNLGNALRRLDQFAAASASFRKALSLQPQRPEFHHGLADCCFRAGALFESELEYRQTLVLHPNFPEVWTSLGLVLAEMGRYLEADECHTEALRQRPEDPQSHRNRSLVRLLLGDYQQGWTDYEWRWRCADFAPIAYPQPRWQGEPLPGGTILLLSEQGIGDSFQFVRYAPLVKRLVGRVILATRRELIPILASCDGIDQLVSDGDDLPAFDVYCPLLSLPCVLNTTPENIPTSIPYLAASSDRIRDSRARMGTSAGLRVGLCWQGSPGNKYYREHGISPSAFAALANLQNVQWVSLQKGISPEELARIPVPLLDFSRRLDVGDQAFMDTAAIISQLDLVISFDTAVAHLAGAMGKPVWIALPFVPDWRWLLNREDSPWYPTARLYRQPTAGNWEQPLQQMANCLQLGMAGGTL